MSEKRTELRDLGEFGLIDRIEKKFPLGNPSSIRGIGDDAAVIKGGDEVILCSTDMLVEGIHFDLSYTPLVHLGYKSIAVNISDIAAMNALAAQVTVNIALSNRFSLEAIDALYDGISTACKNYGVDLVGGDTTSSHSGLIISVTALGRAPQEKVVYRSGARPKDVICVTGDLGAAYMGLQVLQREKQVYLADPSMQPNLDAYEYLMKRQLKAEARTDIIHELHEKNILPTSMIDVSDGLASDLFHLVKHSRAGVRIFEDKIPIDQNTYETAIEFHLDPITCALNGGEDYELLFTVSAADVEKIKDHPDIHLIGYMHDNPSENLLVTKQNNMVPLQAQGWNHFRPDQSSG